MGQVSNVGQVGEVGQVSEVGQVGKDEASERDYVEVFC